MLGGLLLRIVRSVHFWDYHNLSRVIPRSFAPGQGPLLGLILEGSEEHLLLVPLRKWV